MVCLIKKILWKNKIAMSAPVSRALLIAFASASLLCSFDALVHQRSSVAARAAGVARAGGGSMHAGEGGRKGETQRKTASLRIGLFLVSWLAWPSIAETIAGSLLLLRLFACERHLGSPKIALFLISAMVLSFAAALAFAHVNSDPPPAPAPAPSLLWGAGSASRLGVHGWGPSAVYGSLLVRRIVEIPTKPAVGFLGDKGVDLLLALQVACASVHTHAHSHACSLNACVYNDTGLWQSPCS